MKVDSPKPDSVSHKPDFEEAIRTRAYQLYETRGREDGHDVEDWLNAEIELTVQRTKKIAA